MTRLIDSDAFDRFLTDWLDEEAGSRAPAYLSETLARLDDVKRRPAWASLERWLPMSLMTARPVAGPQRRAWNLFLVGLITAALAASLAIAGSLLLRDQDPDGLSAALLVPALELDATWDTVGAGGLDEPILGDIGPDGNLYVVNGGSNEIVVLDPLGVEVARFGEAGDGPGQFDFQRDPDDAFISSIGGVAVGPDGSIYVADTTNDRVQRLDATGRFVSEWGSYGPGDGQFLDPIDLDIGPDGTVFVVDDQRDDIQRFTPVGTYLSTIGRHGSADGEMSFTGAVTVAPDGAIYNADFGNGRVQSWSEDGAFRWSAGEPGTDPGQFDGPGDVAVDPDGNLYVAEPGRIQVLDPEGRWLSMVRLPAAGAEVGPAAIVAAPDGYAYISLMAEHRIPRARIVEVEPDLALTSSEVDDAAGSATLDAPPSAATSAGPGARITFDEFAVPFSIALPVDPRWRVDRTMPGGVEIGRWALPSDGTGNPGFVQAYVVENTFADPCRSADGPMDPPVGPTVDDLVAALTSLEGFEAGQVTDVEIDGHAGKVFDLENRIDAKACDGEPWLPQWTHEDVGGMMRARGPSSFFHQRIYVLDVDGRRVLVESWTFRDTTRENVIEIDEVIRSIDFL